VLDNRVIIRINVMLGVPKWVRICGACVVKPYSSIAGSYGHLRWML
jgi:hypothetical protein